MYLHPILGPACYDAASDKQILERDVLTWEGRCRGLAKERPVGVGGAKYQPPHELQSWYSDQSDC